MEILGSGGFKHWTGKKKSRVVARALDQVNASAEAEADRIVARSMNDRSLQNQDLSLMKETFLSRVFNYLIWGSVHGASAATKNNSCWFTLLSDSQLTADGDVLCIGAYIPPGHRNLPLCSVSSALVLHKLIMRGDITICPKPMSFMALRGILQGGHHVARGPHGHPINSVLCLLPTPNSHLSNCITRAYQALAASQLLTTRWIYTAVRNLKLSADI